MVGADVRANIAVQGTLAIPGLQNRPLKRFSYDGRSRERAEDRITTIGD